MKEFAERMQLFLLSHRIEFGIGFGGTSTFDPTSVEELTDHVKRLIAPDDHHAVIDGDGTAIWLITAMLKAPAIMVQSREAVRVRIRELLREKIMRAYHPPESFESDTTVHRGFLNG